MIPLKLKSQPSISICTVMFIALVVFNVVLGGEMYVYAFVLDSQKVNNINGI